MLGETNSGGAITFRSYGNLGDHIHCLAGIRQVCKDLGKSAVIYIALDVKAHYYSGASHETTDSDGNMVMMNQKSFDLLRPLLMYQDFIEDVRVWKGQQVTVDLTRLHYEFVNMPYGNIGKWASFIFPDMATDLSKPWLDVPRVTGYEDKILVNRTTRYNNPNISFYFLKNRDNVWFTGTPKECFEFNARWELDLPYLEVDDFLELAMIVKSCKFLVGGQSFVYSLAESQKVPRIMEACSYAPNCDPSGEHGYMYYYQKALEYYFDKLNG